MVYLEKITWNRIVSAILDPVCELRKHKWLILWSRDNVSLLAGWLKRIWSSDCAEKALNSFFLPSSHSPAPIFSYGPWPKILSLSLFLGGIYIHKTKMFLVHSRLINYPPRSVVIMGGKLTKMQTLSQTLLLWPPKDAIQMAASSFPTFLTISPLHNVKLGTEIFK